MQYRPSRHGVDSWALKRFTNSDPEAVSLNSYGAQKSIPPAYVAWWAGTRTLFLLGSWAPYIVKKFQHKLLAESIPGLLKSLKIPSPISVQRSVCFYIHLLYSKTVNTFFTLYFVAHSVYNTILHVKTYITGANLPSPPVRYRLSVKNQRCKTILCVAGWGNTIGPPLNRRVKRSKPVLYTYILRNQGMYSVGMGS